MAFETLPTFTKSQAATTGTTSTVAVTTTAAQLVPLRPTRQLCIVLNLDAATNIWVGYNTSLASGSSGNGFRLKPGESIRLSATPAIWAVSESGSVQVSVVEEYN